jgi:hypothetical protein
LLLPRATRIASEGAVVQKRAFKVISPVEKRDGGKFWMRLGTAYVNKDDSINIYLDAMPKSFELQLRELTEEDFARRSSSNESRVPLPAGSKDVNNSLPF